MDETTLVPLEDEPSIRHTVDEQDDGEVWFVVKDVVDYLVDSKNIDSYMKNLRRRDEQLKIIWKDIVKKKRIDSRGGPQNFSCATMEGILRIVQSINSPRANVLKMWLAKVGSKEINELRMDLYRRQGYSEEWIQKRMATRRVRKDLTKVWKLQGVKEGLEYALLTNEISKGAFGLTVKEHKQLKGLEKKHNLRDHMTDEELAVQFVGDVVTKSIATEEEAQGYDQNRDAARRGGKAAGKTRRVIEEQTGRPVVSEQNFIEEPESKARLKPPPQPDDDVPF